MNDEELKRFMEVYPPVAKYEDAALERFSQTLNEIKDRIIIEGEELVVENKGESSQSLSCLFQCLKVKKWHTDCSVFIFLDILLKKIGVVLTGYQNKIERKKFLQLWNENYKNKYKNDINLCSFTWVNEGEDEYAIKYGYFKPIEGTSGKSFNPAELSVLAEYFYWGYAHELEIEKNGILSQNNCRRL